MDDDQVKSYTTAALIFTILILVGIGTMVAALSSGDWRYLIVTATAYYLICGRR